MGQRSGGSLGSPFARQTETPPPYPPAAPPPSESTGRHRSTRAIRLAAAVVAVLLLAAVVGLALAYAGARSRIGATRSALAASRAQLRSVQGALSDDTTALQTEQAVGTYMRGVRDALAPALAAYRGSGSASSASAARADDEQAIAALTSAKRQVSALVLPDSLRSADGDIRAAMDSLAGGLQSEVTAIGTGNLGGLDAALTLEGEALEHLQTALGEMYSAVGTAGPASSTS